MTVPIRYRIVDASGRPVSATGETFDTPEEAALALLFNYPDELDYHVAPVPPTPEDPDAPE